MSMYAIVTHHNRPDEAAESWINDGVCAVGFAHFDDAGISNITKLEEDLKRISNREELEKLLKRYKVKLKSRVVGELSKFLEIKKGDIILAYQKNNTISAVGKVAGDYRFDRSNLTGRLESLGGFEYPNQKKVDWSPSFREFDKSNLPEKLSKQLGRRGPTTTKILGYDGDYDDFLLLLGSLKIPSYEGKYNEELVKGGLSKYVKTNLDELEKGLTVLKEEKPVGERNRPDFIAKDADGKDVLIECKGSRAGIDAIEQVARYKKAYKRPARCFLIAFSFEPSCREMAKKEGIEIFETDLTFKKRT